jgi:hypothetical protein
VNNTRYAEGKVEEGEWGERGGRGPCLARVAIFIKEGNNIYDLKNSAQYPFVLLVNIW